MVENYDISKNPIDLPKSKGITSVRPGASRQHFLGFDDVSQHQDSAHRQLTAYSWQHFITEEGKEEKEVKDLFSTELDEEVYDRYPDDSLLQSLPQRLSKEDGLRDTLKNVTDNHCSNFFEKAIELLEQRTGFEEALININKCLLLKPYHIPFYDIRSELYLTLCDFQSAILSLQKRILCTQVTNETTGTSHSRMAITHEQQAVSIPVTSAGQEDKLTNEKIVFLRYISGITLFDQKRYIDALSIIANGANVFSTLPFQIYSILCLTALNKLDEASTLITQMIEQYPQNADLLIIRARLYYKDKTKLALCFYDIRDALAIQDDHPLANAMMNALRETSMGSRDNCVRMSMGERLNDALASINFAIQLYPIEADFHLQRSIIYRKMKKFQLATDECLMVFDKVSHDEQHRLYIQAQKQIGLIYNDCALKCLQTGFYDDAINLLNRAINNEKSTAGLYMNRGDCFLAKGEVAFAMQDYEQALEMAPNNEEIKVRISNVFFGNAERKYKEKRYQDSCVELTKAIDVNPSMAKYYVSRSRVKYLSEDIYGAQEDIVAAILINPLEEECIDVLPRLFPDTTLAQVLNSSLTAHVKERLLKRGIRLAIH